MKIEYAIIVKNKTRLEALIERYNTKAQAQFYIESLGGNFEDYELEHQVFHQALNLLQSRLSNLIKYKIVERDYVSSFIFSDNQLIIVIGQDGLVANTAKYSKGIPIVAVNPDKDRYDGVLLPFDTTNFIVGIKNVLANNQQTKTMRFAEVTLNNGQRLLAFNDLFIGASSHVSARYRIAFSGHKEEQSSSGMIISTQAGSTAWMSSIFNMTYGIANMLGQPIRAKKPSLRASDLMFAVREPFKSVRTQIEITAGIIPENEKLKIDSLMPSNGIIFSDGIEKDFLMFNSGAIASVGIADEMARLVVKS